MIAEYTEGWLGDHWGKSVSCWHLILVVHSESFKEGYSFPLALFLVINQCKRMCMFCSFLLPKNTRIFGRVHPSFSSTVSCTALRNAVKWCLGWSGVSGLPCSGLPSVEWGKGKNRGDLVPLSLCRMPVLKMLRKASEALLMNCAFDSLDLHSNSIGFLQLDSRCNCNWDEMHNMGFWS